MKVGTAQPPPHPIPHHLIDFLDPKRRFSAGEFVRIAKKTMRGIRRRGKRPIIIGGTGLYIKALVDGLAPLPHADNKIRYKLSIRIKREGVKSLHVELSRIDPESARKIPANNVQRLVRALEVYYLTGTPISEWHKKTMRPTKDEFRIFGLLWRKDRLQKNIEARSARILPGMVRETKELLKKSYPIESPGLQALGYRDAMEYLRGRIDKNELLKRINSHTIKFAKRQMTWFRGDQRIKWISCGKGFNPEKIAKRIAQNIE